MIKLTSLMISNMCSMDKRRVRVPCARLAYADTHQPKNPFSIPCMNAGRREGRCQQRGMSISNQPIPHTPTHMSWWAWQDGTNPRVVLTLRGGDKREVYLDFQETHVIREERTRRRGSRTGRSARRARLSF